MDATLKLLCIYLADRWHDLSQWPRTDYLRSYYFVATVALTNVVRIRLAESNRRTRNQAGLIIRESLRTVRERRPAQPSTLNPQPAPTARA